MRFNRNFRGRGIENLRPKNLRKALDLIFNTNPLDPRITFTRATSRTRINEAGTLVRVPFNMLTYSEQFDNAAWAKTNSSVTLNVTETAAPDGTFTADKLVEAADVGVVHLIQQNVTITSLGTYATTFKVKAGARTKCRIIFLCGAGGVLADADLSAGTIGAASAFSGGTVSGTSTITPEGNGWYRIGVAGSGPAGTTGSVRIELLDASGNRSYNGDGTSGIYIWGAHLNPGTVADDYYPTTTAANGAPAIDYDPVTLACRGLSIWEARTNLLLRSEEFDNAAWVKNNATVTANVVATTAPDGTNTADKLVEDVANSTHYVDQATTNGNATYTQTIYVKAAERSICFAGMSDGVTALVGAYFNLSTLVVTPTSGGSWSAITAAMQSVGSGWYRCTVTATRGAGTSTITRVYTATSSSTVTYTGDGTSGLYIWGAQLEAGSSASPYIPTTTAQVTRAADVAVISGANFSNFYNQTEFSMVAKFKGHASGTRTYFSVSNGTANERIELQSVAGTLTLNVVDGGVTQATLALGSVVTGTDYTVASGWAANDFAASINGGAIVTDGAGTLPTPDRCHIGADYAGANRENTTTAYLTGYPTRLPNATLVALST